MMILIGAKLALRVNILAMNEKSGKRCCLVGSDRFHLASAVDVRRQKRCLDLGLHFGELKKAAAIKGGTLHFFKPFSILREGIKTD